MPGKGNEIFGKGGHYPQVDGLRREGIEAYILAEMRISI